MSINIEIAKLRSITEKLFAHLEQLGHDKVRLSKDYYWSIPQEARYDPYSDPTGLTLGQLSDDWAELEKILRGEKDPLSYGLVWLSSILRAIGEDLVG